MLWSTMIVRSLNQEMLLSEPTQNENGVKLMNHFESFEYKILSRSAGLYAVVTCTHVAFESFK